MSWRVMLAALVLSLSAESAFAENATPEIAAADQPNNAATAAPALTSQPEMFDIIADGGRTLLEIPPELLGREMFWYAEVVDDPPETDGILGNSVGSALVRFERIGDIVYLRNLTHQTDARAGFAQRVINEAARGVSAKGTGNPTTQRALPSQPSSAEKLVPLRRAVEAADFPPVMMSFPVLREGPNGGAVIDVTDAFTSDIAEFPVAASLAGDAFQGGLLVGDVDPKRSYVEQVLAFPKNAHIRTLLTFAPPTEKAQLENKDLPALATPLSVVIGHSITLLPEEPMRPRFSDNRVGYFATAFTDYDEIGEAGGREREIILRRRLEKKDPSQEVSEPVEPIVFYIGRDVTDKWRPYIKQAVED